MNKQPNLGEGSIGKLMLSLALPSIVAQIVNLLYNMVDRIYIGHIPEVGDLALTGLGLCFPVIMIVTAFAQLIGAGGAPRIAIHMGSGQIDIAEEIVGNCTSMMLVIGLILTTVMEIVAEPVLSVFGASLVTMPYALSYLRIYLVGTIFVLVAVGMNPFITTQGFSKIGMQTVLIGAVLNIILDPILIFVLNMGVRGAALATIVSQGVSSIWVIRFLTGTKTKLKIKREHLHIKPSIIIPVLALGVSPFMMQLTESAINIAFNASLSKYGGDIAVGAMTILASVMQLMFIPTQGLTQGTQPIISFNYGANKIDRVKKTYKLLMVCCFLYTATFWALIEICPGFFVRIFNNNSPDLISTATWSLRIYMASMGLFGLQIAVQQTFMSLGQAGISLFIACLRKIILLIPLIYILPMFLENKVLGVFLAEPVADLLSVITATTLFAININKILARQEKATK